MPITDTDATMAAMLAPEDTRYLLLCRECRSAWPYQRDSKTVKAARRGDASCPDCGDELDLPIDAKEDS